MATRVIPSDNVICSHCKKEKPLDGYRVCEKCRLESKKSRQNYINKGLCITGCGNKISIKNKSYCLECREKHKIKDKKDIIKCKRLCLEQYGNKCVCCGENTYEFLTFDHINNDGAKHFSGDQKSRLGSKSLYRWIMRNNFPDIIQILCFNCNCSKGFYGFCPHQKEIDE